MRRILVVYNPRSSRFADVRNEVFPKIRNLKGYIIGKYEVKPTDVDRNIATLSEIIQDDDIVISAGGDATGVIAANAIMCSAKSATLAALPYGNFNDLSRTLRTKKLEDVFIIGKTRREKSRNNKLYPLDIIVDGKHWRYATCYATIGMTAEAVELYDNQRIRRKLKSRFGRSIISYTALANWYFKNRHKHTFVPEFKLNGIKQHPKTSDYFAINGRYMARIMRGGKDYSQPQVFRHETGRFASSFPRLVLFMFRSLFHHIPSTETSGDTIEFSKPAPCTIQAEGESKRFDKVSKIEIRKSPKYIKTIHN